MTDPVATTAKPDWLAKDALDVGLYTNQLAPMLAFWQGEAGLAFDHMIPIGGGVRQHRHDHSGGVFKLNHSRASLPTFPGGALRRLIIATSTVSAPVTLADPDGNRVTLAPPGHDGVTHWAVELATPSPRAFLDFYCDTLGLPRAPGEPCAALCGRSLIRGIVSEAAAPAPDEETAVEPMQGLGFRYITMQVTRVDPVHARVTASGAREGAAPRTLGETARISFIRDPMGLWIELSQRKSVTGSLEP